MLECNTSSHSTNEPVLTIGLKQIQQIREHLLKTSVLEGTKVSQHPAAHMIH